MDQLGTGTLSTVLLLGPRAEATKPGSHVTIWNSVKGFSSFPTAPSTPTTLAALSGLTTVRQVVARSVGLVGGPSAYCRGMLLCFCLGGP